MTEVTVGDRIVRSVRATAAASEQSPLVVRDSDTIALDSRGLTLTRGRVVVRFDRAQQLDPALRPVSTITCPGRRMIIVTVPRNGIPTRRSQSVSPQWTVVSLLCRNAAAHVRAARGVFVDP
ncbi:hypothetical protein ABZX92_27135 [Lentzea sp. NPDC006480]|uniref:hypothetical protein n=1 Tax=Lentzea sp. NPDC006480 TaxID=3157176 RepID=UPI0033AFEF0B